MRFLPRLTEYRCSNTLKVVVVSAIRANTKSPTIVTSFVRNIVRRGHEAVLEHSSLSVKFVCDRGVSHEIVRHRLASYCQESTRYCNYSKDDFQSEITVIEPSYLDKSAAGYRIWERSCKNAETAYFDLLDFGCSPQEARAVLPNSLKTEIVMTADLREWRHFLKLRTSPTAHPQIREVATPLLNELKSSFPSSSMTLRFEMGYRRVGYLEQCWYIIRYFVRNLFRRKQK